MLRFLITSNIEISHLFITIKMNYTPIQTKHNTIKIAYFSGFNNYSIEIFQLATSQLLSLFAYSIKWLISCLHLTVHWPRQILILEFVSRKWNNFQSSTIKNFNHQAHIQLFYTNNDSTVLDHFITGRHVFFYHTISLIFCWSISCLNYSWNSLMHWFH